MGLSLAAAVPADSLSVELFLCCLLFMFPYTVCFKRI
jgi:hypothetical protein